MVTSPTKNSPLNIRVDYLTSLLRHMAASLVERGDEMEIHSDSNVRRVMFTVYVADRNDKALAIGRDGQHANAIRTVLFAACRKLDLRGEVDICTFEEMPRDAPVEPVDKGHRGGH